MFLSLVFKEIKQQFKSIIFYLFISVIVLFYITQFLGDVGTEGVSKPIPPEEYREAYGREPYYGYIEEEDPEDQMNLMYSRLIRDANHGSVLQHGFLMNKIVNLSKEQKEFMLDAADKIIKEGHDISNFEADVSYKEFQIIIEKVDERLGGGTYFSEKYNDQVYREEKTYDQALKDFETMISKDTLSNAYGRLYADYMGIGAGFFPIFLAAFILTRDKRYRMSELIYSREISSYKYVFAKYIALVISVLLVYLAIATHATILVSSVVKANGYTVDYLAFYKYTFGWLVPTLLFTISMGFVISIIYGNGIVAIPIQFGLWISSLLPLIGDYGLAKFILRFNTVGSYDIFKESINDILINRILYTVLAIILVGVAGRILSYRRGRQDGIIKKRFKRKSKEDSRTPSLQS